MSTETNEAKENDVFGVATMPCRMNSVKMITNGNCKEYVLYVNAKDRMNAKVTPLNIVMKFIRPLKCFLNMVLLTSQIILISIFSIFF